MDLQAFGSPRQIAMEPLSTSNPSPMHRPRISRSRTHACVEILTFVALPAMGTFSRGVSCSGNLTSGLASKSSRLGSFQFSGSSISSRISKSGHEHDTSGNFCRLICYSSSNWWRSTYGSYDSDDNIDPYPWEAPNQELKTIPSWLNQEMVTFFTTDGLIQFPGRFSSRIKNDKSSTSWRFKEEDFMDPHQLLCLGALFDISAINGLDSTRRFCVQGFCRSVDMLSAVVEDSVKMQGGQIVIHERKVNEGDLEERLYLTVSVPLLFGVPPAVENLNRAIKHGGGIVDKVYMKWQLF